MKKFILSFLCILLIGSLIIPFLHAAEETRTVSDFIDDDSAKQSTLLQEFENLDGATRNQIIENSKSIGKEKNTFVEKVARDISTKVYNEALKNEFLKQNINILLPDAVTQIKQLNLLDIKDYETFKKLAIKAGIDLNPKDLNKLSRGSLTGFDSPDLKWTTQKTKDGKSLNVIGNSEAGVWLNLEDIPMATKRMEYDSSNKQFILTMKDGGKVIVGKGAIDNSGNLAMFSSLTEKSLVRNQLTQLGNSKKPLGLNGLVVIGNKGQVVLSGEGFEIKGSETKVKYGELTFGRKGEESSSIATFFEDEILIKGLEFEKAGYVRVGSTDYDFVLNFETNPNNPAGTIHNNKKNFLCIYGENFAVGGKGNIEVLRNLNELRGFDCTEFKVKVGDMDLSFREKGVYKENQPSFKNAFIIDNIYAVRDEKSLESPFKIVKSSDGVYTFEAADFVAGKTTFLGKYGISSDFSLVVDKKDLSKIKGKVQGAYFFPESSLVESLKDSDYSYNLDIYVPLEGINIESDSKLKNEMIEKVTPELRKMLNEKLSQSFDVPPFGSRQLTSETKQIIDSLTEKFVNQVKTSSLSGGKYSFKVNNNPGSSPTVSVLIPGNKESKINLNENEKSFVKDMLNIGLIVPDVGSVAYTINAPAWAGGKKEVPYWPANHLKELWYGYLGQKSSSASGYLPVTDDLDLLEEVINKYTKKK